MREACYEARLKSKAARQQNFVQMSCRDQSGLPVAELYCYRIPY